MAGGLSSPTSGSKNSLRAGSGGAKKSADKLASASASAAAASPSIASNVAERTGSTSTITSLVDPSGRSTSGSPVPAGGAKGLKRTPTGDRGTVARWHPSEDENKRWISLSQPEPLSEENIQKSFVKHTVNTLSRTVHNMDTFAAYQATAQSVRDRLIHRWNVTQDHHTQQDAKRIYYMSLEFLIGRSLDNAVLNMNIKGPYKDALRKLGFQMEDLITEEVDAALGNGGLGRLAACFMDSLSTLGYPAWGYGLRYTYGMFQQRIVDGYQVEVPDYWLSFGNAWEVPRLDVEYEVYFYGNVHKTVDASGAARWVWDATEKVQAVAYDVPIPAYGIKNCINIRLWSSKPTKKFDLASFNEGNYEKSVQESMRAENITSVLYPNDNTMAGKELRLKQQYFFVCATLQDIVRRFKKTGKEWKQFHEQVAIQLNDTHPTLSIVELQRVLVDVEGLSWDEAWSIVQKTFAFTNHTVLPEAMEKWNVPMMESLLPRHMAIIYDINLYFLQGVEKQHPGDRDLLARLSIIEEGYPKNVRMAHLAVVACHTVNGVAAIHSSLIKTTIFKDFVDYFGDKRFQNKTNGITPRRWLHQANTGLSDLITSALKSESWLVQLDDLVKLRAFADDKAFQEKWMAIKYRNKQVLADHIGKVCDFKPDPKALFDVQVKRIHEYKRQFMNILSVIHRYQTIKQLPLADRQKVVPRCIIFGGKAAPGYYIAKLVIKLINSVAELVNADADIGSLLKVAYIPDYNVSVAEKIIPASDISQHISTAGTEASGTSNMKFVLNGGLILGTLDGANVEIHEEIGDDNIFIFGNTADKVEDLRHANRYHRPAMDPKLAGVIDFINRGAFGNPKIYQPLLNTLTHGSDFYLISADFASYLAAQKRIDEAYVDTSRWAKRSILCTAGMGKFSSDRSIKEYAEQIWGVQPSIVPSAVNKDL